jgi:hypothetical protein
MSQKKKSLVRKGNKNDILTTAFFFKSQIIPRAMISTGGLSPRLKAKAIP